MLGIITPNLLDFFGVGWFRFVKAAPPLSDGVSAVEARTFIATDDECADNDEYGEDEEAAEEGEDEEEAEEDEDEEEAAGEATVK